MKCTLLAGVLAAITLSSPACADPPPYISMWIAQDPGYAYGFAGNVLRLSGSENALQDFTVAAQLTARNGPGVHQWAFGVASEAWALPGSRSILVGSESSVINEEPTNTYPKIAHNAVMKNRADGAADPGDPMNVNSIAYWISAQPGTGFERGLVFDSDALLSTTEQPPVAIDLSDIPDDRIGQIDLIRIRKDVSLRYDPVSRQLILHIDPPPAS